MTKKERAKLRTAIGFLNRDDANWDEGMKLLMELAGMERELEWVRRAEGLPSVTVLDLPKVDQPFTGWSMEP